MALVEELRRHADERLRDLFSFFFKKIILFSTSRLKNMFLFFFPSDLKASFPRASRELLTSCFGIIFFFFFVVVYD